MRLRFSIGLLTLCILLMPVAAIACSVPVLTITKSGPATAHPGDVIAYTITVMNVTPEPNSPGSFEVFDSVPAGLTFLSEGLQGKALSTHNLYWMKTPFCTADPWFLTQSDVPAPYVACFPGYKDDCRVAGAAILCNKIEVGESTTFNVSFQVPATAACGSIITNRAMLKQYGVSVPSKYSETVQTTVICNASSSPSSSSMSSSSSSAPAQGCIDVVKETYNTQGQTMTPVTQFTFHLDGQQIAYNNGTGLAHFANVSPGTHTVTEDVPPYWTQLSVTPVGGLVQVNPGSACSVVTFKNRQVLPQVTVPPPVYTLPQCSDGIDNDGDARADFFDPGCYPGNIFVPGNYNPNDNDESNPVVLCRWGRVNNTWVRMCS